MIKWFPVEEDNDLDKIPTRDKVKNNQSKSKTAPKPTKSKLNPATAEQGNSRQTANVNRKELSLLIRKLAIEHERQREYKSRHEVDVAATQKIEECRGEMNRLRRDVEQIALALRKETRKRREIQSSTNANQTPREFDFFASSSVNNEQDSMILLPNSAFQFYSQTANLSLSNQQCANAANQTTNTIIPSNHECAEIHYTREIENSRVSSSAQQVASTSLPPSPYHPHPFSPNPPTQLISGPPAHSDVAVDAELSSLQSERNTSEQRHLQSVYHPAMVSKYLVSTFEHHQSPPSSSKSTISIPQLINVLDENERNANNGDDVTPVEKYSEVCNQFTQTQVSPQRSPLGTGAADATSLSSSSLVYSSCALSEFDCDAITNLNLPPNKEAANNKEHCSVAQLNNDYLLEIITASDDSFNKFQKSHKDEKDAANKCLGSFISDWQSYSSVLPKHENEACRSRKEKELLSDLFFSLDCRKLPSN